MKFRSLLALLIAVSIVFAFFPQLASAYPGAPGLYDGQLDSRMNKHRWCQNGYDDDIYTYEGTDCADRIVSRGFEETCPAQWFVPNCRNPVCVADYNSPYFDPSYGPGHPLTTTAGWKCLDQPDVPTYEPPPYSPPPYEPPSYEPPAAPTPTYYGPTCGNAICEFGENSWNCPYDCSSPYYAYCSLNAYPRHVPVGGYSEIAVSYYNLFYSPVSVFIDCGNGQGAYAWGCFGNTGLCYASCYYNQPGSYMVSGYAGGTACYPTYVYADSLQPTPTPTPTYPTPTPPAPTPPAPINPACTVFPNPNEIEGSGSSTITIEYKDFSTKPTQANVICGNGRSAVAKCTGSNLLGSCTTKCDYPAPASYPKDYFVDATVAGVFCDSGVVTLSSLPQPTPEPGALDIYVFDVETNKPIASASVSVSSLGVFYTDSKGLVFIDNVDAGTYSITASKQGYAPNSVSATVRDGETTFVDIGLNKIHVSSCEVSINPTTIRAGSSTSVRVDYIDMSFAPTSALVSCGNGVTATASCSGGQNSGSCFTSCPYSAEPDYPAYYTVSASVGGAQCSAATAKIVQPELTTGSILTRVTQCVDGAPLRGARVDVTNTLPLYTDEFGDALVSGLQPGGYTVTASYPEFVARSASAVVYAGQTTNVAICLDGEEVFHTFDVDVINTPMCPYQTDSEPYQIKITNNLDVPQTIYISFDSEAVYGPTSVFLLPYESTIVDFNVFGKEGYTGGELVPITFTGASETKTITLAFCASGGLSLQVIDDDQESFSDNKVCYRVLVRNKGLSSSIVNLAAETINGAAGFSNEFLPQSFFIQPQEIKDAQFCVNIPGGATTSPSYLLTARSNINDAVASAVLKVLTSKLFYSDFNGCPAIDESTTVNNHRLKLTNNALSGDYQLELADNELNAFIEKDLLNFAKGSTRELNLRLNGFGKQAAEYNFDLNLKKDGRIVFTQPLCFKIKATDVLSGSLREQVITVPKGGSKSVLFKLTNSGTARATYTIKAEGSLSGVSVFPDTITIGPGEQKDVEVHVSVSDSVAAGAYSIPIRVYSGGVTLSGRDDADVNFNCGNGETARVTCYEEDEECEATCDYSSAGTYYPSASIAGMSCSAQTRVLSFLPSNAIIITPEENSLLQGETTTIFLDYYSLTGGDANAPVISNVRGVRDASKTTATITWTTNEAADSQVEYGVSNSLGSRVSNTALVTSHSVIISSLNADQLYYYQVKSCDSDNNCNTAGVYTLDATPPVISGLGVQDITNQSAKIVWSTDESSDSRIEWGVTTALGNSTTNSDLVTSHSITLGALSPATIYYYKATSCDSSGSCASSGVNSFTTLTTGSLAAQNEVSFDSIQRTFTINCGNGVSKQVTCSGSTGVCETQCTYPSSGTYTVTASVNNANPTVYSAQVKVSDTNRRTCALTAAPENLVVGEETTLVLRYFNVDLGTSQTSTKGGLVETASLLVNVVTPTGAPLEPVVNADFRLSAPEINLQGNSVEASITIENQNYYSLSNILLYASDLPPGVSADAVPPFDLNPGESKVVKMRFRANNAVPGKYLITLQAKSPLASTPEAKIDLTVGAAVELNVGIDSSYTLGQENGKNAVFVEFKIWNNEPHVLSVITRLDTPANWSHKINPIITLAPGETTTITATIYPNEIRTDTDYKIRLWILSGQRSKQHEVLIRGGDLSIFSGLFVFLSSEWAIILLLIAGLIAGAALLYRSHKNLSHAEEVKTQLQEKSIEKKDGKIIEKTEKTKTELKKVG